MIPVHERRILEAHVRRLPLNRLALVEAPLDEYQSRELKDLIKLRMRGLPLQYLTGSQDFYGREFYVNTGVLVPRPETEGLVELVLNELPVRAFGDETMNRLHGLEFGAGSGCISLTLALERPDVTMIASDCSAEALAVAEENARKFRVGSVDFLAVSAEPQEWQYDDVPALDFIVSNPPYLVESDEIAEDVRAHEPSEALFAPAHDPLLFYRFLSQLIESKLRPGGFAAFEISSDRAAESRDLFASCGYDVTMKNDLTDRARYLVVRKNNG